MNDLISIIVSAYNIEEYVKECLTSIKNQTYENIEVLVINDGSTDKTPEIINCFCKKNIRFKLYSKKNGGPSSARNYGLKFIKGKYFMFVDGDDVLDPNCIKSLYDSLIETKTDISICSYEKYYSKYSNCAKKSKNYIFNKNDYYKEILNFKKDTYVWGILYPIRFKNIIKFPVGKYFEDLAVFPSILEKCNRICFLEEKYIKYRQNNNSIVHVYNERKIIDYLEYSNLFVDNILNKKSNMLSECNLYLANAYMTAIYLSIGYDNSNHKEYKKIIKELLKNTNIKNLS